MYLSQYICVQNASVVECRLTLPILSSHLCMHAQYIYINIYIYMYAYFLDTNISLPMKIQKRIQTVPGNYEVPQRSQHCNVPAFNTGKQEVTGESLVPRDANMISNLKNDRCPSSSPRRLLVDQSFLHLV